MCCNVNENSKTSLLRRFGKHKTLKLWKCLYPSGRAAITYYKYGPGEHIAKWENGNPWTSLYDWDRPRGILVCRRKPAMRWSSKMAFQVVVRKEDLVCADNHQAVFRKIRILKKDWVAAGLPLKKVRA